MQFTTKTVAHVGVDANLVRVQCQVSRGMHNITIVGLPDKAVREAKERIQAALYANSIALPPLKITFNLSPADIPKSGNHFDLPMAIALLVVLDLLPAEEMNHYISLGALALDGKVERVNGVLAAALEAAGGQHGLICPRENAQEALLVPGQETICPSNLGDLIQHFKGNLISNPSFEKKPNESLSSSCNFNMIKGLEVQRRAIEISAAGRHHLLMVGSPGAGKSMLASMLPTIMPPMSAKETLQTSLVHSVASHSRTRLPLTERPFYDPHHTATIASIIGGGTQAGPGEISLAHNGVLFLDEFPEFRRDVLESLRQPLETGEIMVSRANAHIRYPAKFLLVAAANPCKCGDLHDAAKACHKAPVCGQKYFDRLSAPLLDRFSLWVQVPATKISDLQENKGGESSAEVRERVKRAREIQFSRNGEAICNEDLNNVQLDREIQKSNLRAKNLIQQAANRFDLTPRGYYRMIKVARTIADLSGSEVIEADHIAETAIYRHMKGQPQTIFPLEARKVS